MPEYKTYTYNGVQYTYYFDNSGTPYLGTNTQNRTAVDPSLKGSLTLPDFIVDEGKKYLLEHISWYAFFHTSLTKLVFPSPLKYVAGGCCESMGSLEYVDLSLTKLTYINGFFFSGCGKLKTVLLPPSITRLYNYSFQFAYSLKFLTIYPNMKLIPNVFSPYDPCHLETIFYCGTFDNGLKLPSSITKVIVPRNYQGEKFSNLSVERTSSKCAFQINNSLMNENRITSVRPLMFLISLFVFNF